MLKLKRISESVIQNNADKSMEKLIRIMKNKGIISSKVRNMPKDQPRFILKNSPKYAITLNPNQVYDEIVIYLDEVNENNPTYRVYGKALPSVKFKLGELEGLNNDGILYKLNPITSWINKNIK